MFEFLFQDRNKELRSTAEMIAVELEKLNLSKLEIGISTEHSAE